MYTDTHTHTTFSTDSVMKIHEAVESAIQKNLSGIAFTDHYDYAYTASADEFHYDIDEYFNVVNSAKEKYNGKLSVYTAIEVGFQPHIVSEVNQIINKYDFDFIIGSTHLIHGIDPYDGKYFQGREKKECYLEYIQEVYKNLILYDNFDAIGHFDYHVRYVNMFKDRTFCYNDFSDIMDMIFMNLIERGKALEINTSTYQKVPLDTAHLKRYKELGGELVTIGSDAHKKEDIARIFDEYIPIIKECGFDYLVHYKERKPVFTKIKL